MQLKKKIRREGKRVSGGQGREDGRGRGSMKRGRGRVRGGGEGGDEKKKWRRWNRLLPQAHFIFIFAQGKKICVC